MIEDRIALATRAGPLGMFLRLRPIIGKLLWRSEAPFPRSCRHQPRRTVNRRDVVRFTVPRPIDHKHRVTLLEKMIRPARASVRRAQEICSSLPATMDQNHWIWPLRLSWNLVPNVHLPNQNFLLLYGLIRSADMKISLPGDGRQLRTRPTPCGAAEQQRQS